MKTSLLAAAAAAAAMCAAAPSFALDYTPNGFVGADYSYDHYSLPLVGGVDGNSYGVSGSTSLKLTSVLNVEGDADYTHVDLSSGGGSFDTGGGDLHVFGRDDRGAFGLVGGAHREGSTTVGDFGAEAIGFFDKFSVNGDFRTAWTDTSPEVHANVFDLGGHYYVTDNLRLDATAGYDRLSIQGKFANGWDLGVGGEYRFAKTPFSVYASYDHDELTNSTLKDEEVHVGVRWNFDTSLKARERLGATFAGSGSNAFSRVFGLLF